MLLVHPLLTVISETWVHTHSHTSNRSFSPIPSVTTV